MRRLTYKQKEFVKEYVKTKSPTKAALKAYDVKNNKSASVVGALNMHKPAITNRIDEILKEAEYNPVNSIKSVMKIEEEAGKKPLTYGHSLKASEMLLKISSTLIEKSQTASLNVTVDNMSPADLLALKKRYDKLLE